MTIDRTERTRRPEQVAGVGLLGARRLITRRPGTGGPRSLLLGALLVAVALLVFVQGLDADRVTLGYDAEQLAARWNTAVEATDRQRLRLAQPRLEQEQTTEDLVFSQSWSTTLALRGRADPETLRLVELSLVSDPARDDVALVTAAMDLLVAVTEPTLDHQSRTGLLQELGVAEGTDGIATRGATDYRFAVDATGRIGLSAAPTTPS